MHKKYMGIIGLVSLILIGFIFPNFGICAASEDKGIDKTMAMAEALKESEEDAGLPAGYKQKLGQAVTPTEEGEPPQELDAYIRFMPKVGAKNMPGGISFIQSTFEYSYNFKILGGLPVQFGLGSEYIGITNTTEVEMPAHLTNIAFGAQTTFPLFFKNTYGRIGIAPSFPTDNWRVSSSAFRMPIQSLVIYQPTDKLTLVLGVAVFPSNEDPIAPIGGLIYKYNYKLTFNLIPPKPEISYSLSDNLNVFVEGGLESSEFQVKKDGYKKAILTYNEMRIGAGLRYSLNKFIDAIFSAGDIFRRNLKYRDSLGKISIKDGLYTEFRVEAKF